MNCSHNYIIYDDEVKICSLCNNIDDFVNVSPPERDEALPARMGVASSSIIDICIHQYVFAPHKVCKLCGLFTNEYLSEDIDNNEYKKRYKHKYNMYRKLNLMQGHSNINYNDSNLQNLINDLKQIKNINYNIASRLIKKNNITDILLRDIYHIYNLYSIYVQSVLNISNYQINTIKLIFNRFISFWFSSEYSKNRNNVIKYDFILMKIIIFLHININLSIFKLNIKRKTYKFYSRIWNDFIKTEKHSLNLYSKKDNEC